MPGHVRAADALEDLWRCHECGWTYPNHHPSAKHRRNHKKQCGKIPGFTIVTDLKSSPHVGTGSSSDDGSSDEDHHPLSPQEHKKNDDDQEHPQFPSPVAATSTEQVSLNDTDPTPRNGGGPHVTSKVNENSAISDRSFDIPTSKVQSPRTLQASDQGRSTLRSAHKVKGQWSCRHCGWIYPNAHPSAKSRRKHKKMCGLVAEHSLPGGSSDEASSSDDERNCLTESSKLTETQEPPECNPSVSQESLGAETINEVRSRGLQTDGGKLMVTGREGADNAKDIPLESGLSYSQAPHDASRINGVLKTNGHEKLDVGDAQVSMVEDGNILPTVTQAPVESGAPDVSDVPVLLTESINLYQSQALGEIRNRTAVSEKLNFSKLDEAVTDRQPSSVSTEHDENGKLDLSQSSPQNIPRENGDKSSNYLTKEGGAESSIPQSQSPVIPGRESFKYPVAGSSQLDVKNNKLNPTTRVVAGKSPSTFEARSPPESPEGLVRSRVQIFEQLAATTPQSRSPKIRVSPTVNSASPRIRKFGIGTTHSESAAASHSNGSLKDPQETMSHLRHQQSNGGRGQFTSKQDAPSELYEVMAHLRHRANSVQNECNEVRAEGK